MALTMLKSGVGGGEGGKPCEKGPSKRRPGGPGQSPGQPEQHRRAHGRRIYTEEKAKVVAAALRTELIQFLTVLGRFEE